MRKIDLAQNNYISSSKFNALVNIALNNRPVSGAFLFGPAGTGKTFLAETVAEGLGANINFFQCFPGTREDDLLVKLLPSETTVSGIAMHDGVISKAIKACQTSDKDTVLILDEWDKTRPSADSFLLDFLQTGRVNYNGYSAQLSKEQLSKLIVFITMNDERDLSEPLLRRLPKIDFNLLSSSDIRTALLKTHPESTYINNAVILYERCCTAQLSKPCTIQELRQLLDAIETAGEQADWDTLVYTFITKTPENHYTLSRTEGRKMPAQERAIIEVENYEENEAFEEERYEAHVAAMPKQKSIRKEVVAEQPAEPEQEQPDDDTTLIVENNETNYDKLIHSFTTNELPEDPFNLNSFIKIDKNKIQIKECLHLKDFEKIKSFWGQEGEVIFTYPECDSEDIIALRDNTPLKFVEFSAKRVLGYYNSLSFKYERKKGAEIIVSLKSYNDFKEITNCEYSSLTDKNYLLNKYSSFDSFNNYKPTYFGLVYRKTILNAPVKKAVVEIFDLHKIKGLKNSEIFDFLDKDFRSHSKKLLGEDFTKSYIFNMLNKCPDKFDLNGHNVRLGKLLNLKTLISELEFISKYYPTNFSTSGYSSSSLSFENLTFHVDRDVTNKIKAELGKETATWADFKNFINKKIQETKKHISWLNSKVKEA